MPKTMNWPTLALDMKKTMMVEVAEETCGKEPSSWKAQGRLMEGSGKAQGQLMQVAEATCGKKSSSLKMGPRIMPPPTPSIPAAIAPNAT